MARTPIPVDYDKVETLAAQGLTLQQIAHHVGMQRQRFYDRKRSDPRIADAVKRGQARGQASVTNSLYTQATENGNVLAQIFWLKNRAGWTDKQEVSADQKAPLQVQVISYGASQSQVEQVSSESVQITHYGSDGQRQLTDKYGKAIPQVKGGEPSGEAGDNG